ARARPVEARGALAGATTTTAEVVTTSTLAATTAPPARPTTTSAPTTTRAVTTTTGPRALAPATGEAGAPGPAWSLFAVGDVVMDDTEAAGRDPFAEVRPALGGADLAVVNLEMAISDRGEPEQKAYTFRAAPSAATTLARAGIDAANLANNHSLDFGPDALLDTIDHLRAGGVSPVGAGAGEAEAWAPALFVVKGVSVAVLGTTRVLPRRAWAAGSGPGVASGYDERRLLAAVRAARTGADVVVVAVHWGTEGSRCPDATQVRLAAALTGAGASVVLGSHPHVLQPVVPTGSSVVAYSLGNFVFHRREGAAGETAVLEVRFAGAQITEHLAHPHVLDRGPPRPAGGEAAARIATALANPDCGA
ncbi:MAG: CapA family protein, partial [Acidimicrobiales bacterium]